MIDPAIIKKLPSVHPSWNDKVCHGLAVEEAPKIPAAIDAAMRSAFESLGPDLKYKGYHSVSPKEQFAEITRPRGNKNLYEQSKSSTTMFRYEFEFMGEKLRNRYMFLPYVDYGGIVTLRDSRYVYPPTIADTLFSVEDGKIFIPITRSPVTFLREGHYYLADDALITADTYWSRLHNTKKDEPPKSRHPQILNYIFALYGVVDGFKFMGFDAAVVGDESYAECDFPADEWVRCKSSGLRPKSRIPNYRAPTVNLLIKKDQVSRTAESLIASFFYIADNCADLDYMVAENMDSPILWRRALSRFIWKSADPREAVNDINIHLASLEEYMDELMRKKLIIAKVPARTIWELFRYVLLNYHDLTIKSEPASIANKQLSIVGPMIHDIVIMINNMMFALRKLKEKNWRKDTIEDLLNRNFKQNVISSLASDHPEISLLETATDSMTMKVTGLIYRPSKNTGSATAADMQNPMYWLRGDSFELFSSRMITKSSPTASNRVNPNIKLGPANEVILDPDLQPFRDEIDKLR